MRTIFRNNKPSAPTAAVAPRDKAVTKWETRVEVVCTVLDMAAVFGLVTYAVAITLRIADIV